MGQNFIHCDVYNWNKTVKEELKKSFEALRELYRLPIYAVHEITQDNKHKKFLNLFGFKHINTTMDTEGNPVEIYVRNNNG